MHDFFTCHCPLLWSMWSTRCLLLFISVATLTQPQTQVQREWPGLINPMMSPQSFPLKARVAKGWMCMKEFRFCCLMLAVIVIWTAAYHLFDWNVLNALTNDLRPAAQAEMASTFGVFAKTWSENCSFWHSRINNVTKQERFAFASHLADLLFKLG